MPITVPEPTSAAAIARRCIDRRQADDVYHQHHALEDAGHAITWVALDRVIAEDREATIRAAIRQNRPLAEYIHHLTEAYRTAAEGSADWPPAIWCHETRDGRIKREDGAHRSTAARLAKVGEIPVILFPDAETSAAAMRNARESYWNRWKH